jgi:homoserine dehydrogenase
MSRIMKICLMGFGNVSQAFVQLVERKKDQLAKEYGVGFKFTAIATGKHGRAINPEGIDTDKALELYKKGQSLDSLSSEKSPRDIREFIAKSHADILLENSPVSYKDGEPAIKHVRAALENGIHAVSANKGPVAHAWQELTVLAKSKGKHFLFESTVMDGAPIFSVVRETLPAAEILGFEGILNSCTNLIIEQMEEGDTFDEAVEYAQSIGIAETDPSGDIDGWDAAIKVSALVTVLMGSSLKPQQVQREGIRDLSQTEVQQALKDGERWKLVCRADRMDGKIIATVAPEIVQPKSPLYSVNGTSSLVVFNTDVLPGLGILESNPGPETTAYGLLADILHILKTKK